MVVGALKVCLAATMSIGRTSRSPLPGLTPSSSALSLWRGDGEFRRLGEGRLTIEVEIERRADQRQAAEPGERDAGQPTRRKAAPLARLDPPAADFDRRFVAEFDDEALPLDVGRRTNETGGESRHGLSCRSLDDSAMPMIPLLAAGRRARNASRRPRRDRSVLSAITMAVVRRTRRRVSIARRRSARAAARAIATVLQKEFDSDDDLAYTGRTDGVGALAADAARDFGTTTRRAPPC